MLGRHFFEMIPVNTGLNQFNSDDIFRLFYVLFVDNITDQKIQYLNISALDLFHTHYIEDIISLPFINFVGAGSQELFRAVFNESPRIGRNIDRFKASFIGMHGDETDVIVNGSWIRFNNRDALHLILTEVSFE